MTERRKTNYIVVHCTATKPEMDIDAEWVRKIHRGQGWLDIGYHKVIKRDGTIENGRDINAIGAHVKGYNSQSIGVALVGGVDNDLKAENNYTDEQFSALQMLLLSLSKDFPDAEIVGHYNLDDRKECPSFDVKKWVGHNVDLNVTPPSDVEI
jgi:N-acetyl-anhydromuramyl-L-alanine amidase AmpD|tara:strand:+ start:5193 stop:5651 length:459 start_codon:yes stop_codon:yes gene_type:complete